jgi:hypothetical protein
MAPATANCVFIYPFYQMWGTNSCRFFLPLRSQRAGVKDRATSAGKDDPRLGAHAIGAEKTPEDRILTALARSCKAHSAFRPQNNMTI